MKYNYTCIDIPLIKQIKIKNEMSLTIKSMYVFMLIYSLITAFNNCVHLFQMSHSHQPINRLPVEYINNSELPLDS